MDILFTDDAWGDYQYWRRHNKKVLRRINKLIEAIQEHPFDGIGKPEALKYDLSGLWSRRIDAEHRLVYKIEGNKLIIVQCRYHY